MKEYNFITYWKVNAPVQDTWEIIMNTGRWHEWWKGVLDVHEIKKGNDGYTGACFSHTWRSFIPYKLKFVTEITEVNFNRTIKANVTGELEGTGEWKFKDDGSGNTTVIYYWHVRTTMAWMNITAPLLSGIFRWNHDTVMRWGGMGLGKKLNCKVEFSSEWIH